MAKPSISTRRTRPRWRPLLLVIIAFLCAPARGAPGPLAPSADAEKALWAQADALANRLREERRKLRLIGEELERLRYMGEDFRDLQLYPSSVTGLGPDDDVRLDRMIEGLEKKLAATRKRVADLEKPLDDAFFIAREMLEETPNRDMVEILMKDNVGRIARLVSVQRELNRHWDDASALLAQYGRRIGMGGKSGRQGLIEDDFFRVLMANVGRASQRFSGELNDYKDSLAARSGRREWEKMANLDLSRIRARLVGGAAGVVRDDLERLSRRYSGRISIGKIDYWLGASLLAAGEPLRAAGAFARVGEDSRMYGPACLGVLEALFASRQDDSVLAKYDAFAARGAFDGRMLPPARYLAVQSAYALGRDTAVERLMGNETRRSVHWFKSLFVYAKSLVRSGRATEARGVLGNLIAEAQLEKGLRARAEMALAHLDYEERRFERALKGYQALLDREGFQAEALYGMVWCNIRMGDPDAGEFVLKKLIAQYPDNPWAIEGLNVLVRKVLLKARTEWEFRLQVDRQEELVRELSAKLKAREDADLLAPGQAEAIRAKLAKARNALARQNPLPPESIARLFDQGLGLCDFVEEHYKSGEYSDAGFNRQREEVLAKLADSAETADTSAAGSLGGTPDFRMQVKRKLFESRSLALDIHVMHKAWLEELLKYTQKSLNRRIAALKGDTARTAERARLSVESRRLADDISERLAGEADDILRRIRELSEDPNAAGIMDWLLFHKGYLNYGLEGDALRKRMAARQWLELQSDAPSLEVLAGAGAAGADPAKYEAPWLELIARYPASPFRPAALYYLGYARTLRGEPAAGLGYFEELAAAYPQSPYAQQALIYAGEFYFNENALDKAAEAYDKVLDYPDSRYFEQALYKLAWTRYRANAYKTAISSFTFILEESARKGAAARGRSVLASEALQFAALSIAESDTSGDGGLMQTQAFADKLGDARLGAKLLHRMAVIYRQSGRLDRAKKALEALLGGYPGYERMPEALMELGKAYEKEQDYARAAEVREKIFRLYCRGGDWYAKLPGREARALADSVSEQAVELVARHYLYEAKELAAASGDGAARRIDYLRKAVNAYQAFLSIYPGNPNRTRYEYQQAEALYSLGEYAAAARKYMRVSREGDAKLRKAAAFNAIVSAQELMRRAEREGGGPGARKGGSAGEAGGDRDGRVVENGPSGGTMMEKDKGKSRNEETGKDGSDGKP